MKASVLIVLLGLSVFSMKDLHAGDRPNVLLIICDDLNDYIECLGGHPNTRTPNVDRLANSGVSFTQAHCNIPICGPSRASLFTGIYPHHSGCYGFEHWNKYEVLQNSRTLMDHYRANGYYTLGTGKLMHQRVRNQWIDYGNIADYGPFPFDGEEKVAHPDVPSPFRDIGAIDGSFGPLINLAGRETPEGKTLRWQTGGWNQVRTLRVQSQQDRDLTADELNGNWAVENLQRLAENPGDRPFFMGVGFIRPHTPLIVPQRFFEQFPLDSIELPVIQEGDIDDTHARSVRGIPGGKEPNSERTADMGSRLYDNLVASYPSREHALRLFIQAYLASVASVDEQLGRILDVIDRSSLKDNTIVVFTSDHGWGMGEKDYLYKNSLWQESTQVPLIVRAPGVAKAGHSSPQPVSLIDVYPTLVELCQLTSDTRKNDKGRTLDGHSMMPLLQDPESGQWSGPDEALTALYKWATHYRPSEQSYSLRSADWRYIRYSNGKEELYRTTSDPHEWNNLADEPEYSARLASFRAKLEERLPDSESVPPQPAWKPATKAAPKLSNEDWKNQYFAKHPEADANQDGSLSWAELKAYRIRIGEIK